MEPDWSGQGQKMAGAEQQEAWGRAPSKRVRGQRLEDRRGHANS